MNERRLFAKGVDADTVLEYIENGHYRYANNINMGITDTGNAGTVENSKGNTQVLSSNLAAVEAAWNTNFSQGTFKVIGSKEDPTNKRLFYFVKNTPPTGATQFDRILEYSYETNSIDVVLIHPFGFDEANLITGINIIDSQLLYWTDNWISPRKINIDKAKRYMVSAGTDPLGYTLVSNEVSEAIKYPPLFPPTVSMENNTASNKNNIRGKLFQFKYFYHKDDGEESCFSPISEVLIPQGDEFIDPTVSTLPAFSTVNNRIRIKVNTGGYLDTKIGIAVRQGNVGDFYLVDTLDKAELGLSNFVIYDYLFDNDKILAPIPIQKSIQLFDNLPRLAQAQEYIDGNRLVYANVLEGYDNNIPLDVSITPSYTSMPSATFEWAVNGVMVDPIYGSVGISLNPTTMSPLGYSPEVGDVIIFLGCVGFNSTNVFSLSYELTQPDIDDFFSGAQTLRDNIAALSQEISPPLGFIYVEYTPLLIQAQPYCLICSPTSVTIFRPIKKYGSFKSGAMHPFGLVYYDFANRSGTTLRNSTFDVYAKSVAEQPANQFVQYIQRIGMDWQIKHVPPIWATHYQWVYTGNTSVSTFLQFAITGTVNPATNGTSTDIDLYSLSDYLTTYPQSILSYSWTRGDRIRFLTDSGHGKYLTYLDVEILGFTAPTLTIQLVSASGTTISQGTLVEIYTPELTTEEKIYYEFSQCFEVGNAGQSNRYHKGETQNQDPNNPTGVPATGTFERGDVWIRPRRFNIATSGSAAQYADDYVEDYNVSDFYESDVWDKGRPNRVSEENLPLNGGSEYREIRRPTTIPYSDVYVPETNINGLSRFYDFAFNSYDNSFKSIQFLFSNDRMLECYQELKVGAIPINTKIAVDSSNNVLSYQTSEVLNEMRYYDGDYGIGTNPESFSSNKSRRYFVDVNRGFVCRLSTDGITPISQTYKIHSYITNLFRQITNGSSRVNIYGVFNKAFQRYEFALEQIGKVVFGQEISPVTIGFTDADAYKAWTSWFDYHPEGMCEAAQDFVSFKNGEVWTHNTNTLRNNFYGTQYSSEIWVVGNQNPNEVKVYNNTSLESTEAFEAYEIINNQGQLSNLITSDFELYEGKWYASFWKAQNTPNVTNALIEGDSLRDSVILLKLRNASTGYVKILAVNIEQTKSFRTL